jgi:hypothetical protein
MTVTIFKNFGDKTNPYQYPIQKALQRIKGGKSKKLIELIRTKVFTGEEYDQDKKSLPFVVFAAATTQAVRVEKEGKEPYETHRLDESVTEHSGLFVLDFDDVDPTLKIEQLKKDPYIYACWLAPSGKGVKALVKCPPSIEAHDLYYTAFLDRYPELDPTSRNISRGTFESYDPDLYLNEKSLVWDKRMSAEEHKRKKEKEKNKRSVRVLATAVSMVRASYDGNKHESLRDAAVLLGGYIASGRVNEDEALKLLESEITLKKPKDMEGARKTIRDGIDYGKARPLHETKKIEKAQEFLRRDDGSYDFMADLQEMKDYEQAIVDGTLEMGLPTGINPLNEFWMFKKNHLVWFAGLDNVGKSFFVWYLAVLAAMHHGWRFLIYSSENDDGELRKKLKEFYIGKSVKVMDPEENSFAEEFVLKHFKIMASTEMHNVDEMLIKAEIVYDEGYEFDCFIAEPYNSFEPVRELDAHRNNLYNLNKMRVFKKQYASLWIADHVYSDAARATDKDGYIKVPYKSQVEGGQIKANKVDDFITVHRLVNHPERKNDTEVHVQKIRSRETGGGHTDKDLPVIVQMNMGYCGYSCNGIDPVYSYWRQWKTKSGSPSEDTKRTITSVILEESSQSDEETPF